MQDMFSGTQYVLTFHTTHIAHITVHAIHKDIKQHVHIHIYTYIYIYI